MPGQTIFNFQFLKFIACIHIAVTYLCDYLVNICQFFQAESPVRWPGIFSISLSITSTVPGALQALKRDSKFKEGIIEEDLGVKMRIHKKGYS